MRDVTIIVPVKDEEAGLSYLVNDFRESSIDDEYIIKFIFVIDIRTSDSSKKIASELSEVIIDQSETTGKGSAIKQAVEKWRDTPTELIVFLDADGSYSFKSVRKILKSLGSGYDVVSGSRFLTNAYRPEGMSLLHAFGNRFLSRVSSFRNRRKISDLCTGLWGFREEALKKINLNSKGFDLEAELSGLIRKENLSHEEIKVDWSQRKGGTSKLRSFTDGFIILMRILRT